MLSGGRGPLGFGVENFLLFIEDIVFEFWRALGMEYCGSVAK